MPRHLSGIWQRPNRKWPSRSGSRQRRLFKSVPSLGAVGQLPKISILSLNYPPEPTGIAAYTGSLGAALAEAGYRVSAHVAHPHYPEWKIQSGYGQWSSAECLNGVLVRRMLHYVPRPPRGIKRLASEMSFGIRLVLANWGSPQAVIALSPPLFSTALAVLRLRITPRRPRLIVWVQDIYSLGLAEIGEGGALAQHVTRKVEAYTLRAADRVVVIHERFADFVVQELGVATSRVVVVRNWSHLQRPDLASESNSAKAILGWPNDVTLAVHTGNMGAKQGLENILDAAKIADEMAAPVHFILVGDGGERRNLERYARGISRVSFVDPLSDVEYRLALAAADVLLVNEKPGVATLAMPSKLTSYFDAGRPVVAATDLDGITASEIEAAGAGIVVSAGDPNALLDAVLSLRQDSIAAARYGRNGRRHREEVLSQGAAVQSWTEVINEAIAGFPSKVEP